MRNQKANPMYIDVTSFFMRIKQTFILFLMLFFSHTVVAGLDIQHWQTKTGAEVYFVENHALPIVDVSVNFSAGSARDSAEKSGVASMTRHLMLLGAAGMTDAAISTAMADVGAVLNGSFDADRAEFRLRTLSSTLEKEQAMAVFNKILQQPDFPSHILQREKARVISGLQESATQPEHIAHRAFMTALYAQHPYHLDESGEVATVDKIKREDLQDFYHRHYGAQGAVIALIGDLTREEAHQLAESMTHGLPKATPLATIPRVVLPTQSSEQRLAHTASQSHILLGYPGIKRGDADFFPLYVGNYILGGGGFVSRLTAEVREKRGLVYSVYSYFMPMAEFGPFQIGLQTKKEQAEIALEVVHESLDHFFKDGVTEAELSAAKANIIGGFPLRIDSNGKILTYLAMIGFYKLPLDYLDTYNENVAKVTAKQIKEAFSRRIKPDHFVTVVVGDPTVR